MDGARNGKGEQKLEDGGRERDLIGDVVVSGNAKDGVVFHQYFHTDAADRRLYIIA